MRRIVRGDTDRATAAELVAPAVTELIDRAERAITMVDVHALAEDLRQLPRRARGRVHGGEPARAQGVQHRPPRLHHDPHGRPAGVAPGAAGRTRRRRRAPARPGRPRRPRRRRRPRHAGAVPGGAGAVRAAAAAVPRDHPDARALIVVVDPTRGWTPMSDSFTSLLGYDRRESAADRLIDLVHPEDRPAAIGTFVTACARRAPARLRRPAAPHREPATGGSSRSPCRSFVDEPDARRRRLLRIDVTSQRETERAVRVERGRLLSLVETAP